jgi:hypothetical protein
MTKVHKRHLCFFQVGDGDIGIPVVHEEGCMKGPFVTGIRNGM